MEEQKYGLDVVKIRLVKEDILGPDRIVDTPKAAVDVLCEELTDLDREVFCVINVRADQSVINMNFVSIGTINSAPCVPKDVFKSCILSNAAAVVMIHNHPSGRVQPSASDYDTTKQLVDAGKLLGIQVLDHIIVSGRDPCSRYSFMEHRELGKSYAQVQRMREAR